MSQILFDASCPLKPETQKDKIQDINETNINLHTCSCTGQRKPCIHVHVHVQVLKMCPLK